MSIESEIVRVLDADRQDLPLISIVIVVYGEEPWLERSINAALQSHGVTIEVVLVENGGSESIIERFEADARVVVVRPGRNTGFAEGCNLGVEASAGQFIALINPDAIVEPDAIKALLDVARRPEVGIATASLRLASVPDRMNSAGNEINFLGLSWAGHFDEPATAFPHQFEVISASGAAMMCTRELWDHLGGFPSSFFAYYEDTEFSLRTWQQGLSVVFVPEAVVLHRYTFSRNAEKYFLLERNRLVTTLTCFDRRHLIAIIPALLVMELNLIAMAARDGWLSQKMRAYLAVASEYRSIVSRRRSVMNARIAEPGRLLDLFVTHVHPGNMPDAHPSEFLQRSLKHYWHTTRVLIRR